MTEPNQTCSPAVWRGPDAVDAPLDVSSASGVVAHAAWIGGAAIAARWSFKIVKTIESAASSVWEVTAAVALDIRTAVGSFRRELGATAQVLADRTTEEAALLIEYAGSLCRLLFMAALAVVLWAVNHRAWNHFMHALQ